MRFLYLVPIFLSILLQATDPVLPLPKEFANKRVFHLKAPVLSKFICGYQTIYNACRIEELLGRSNVFHNNQIFKDKIGNFLTKKGLNPNQESPSDVLFELARYVKLQNFHFMVNDDNVINPILTGSLRVSIPKGSTPAQEEKIIDNARIQARKKIMSTFKNNFENAPKGKPYVLHFTCYCVVKNEEHGILISIAKDKNGRKSLYVYDNNNHAITEKSDIYKYIRYFSNLFDF